MDRQLQPRPPLWETAATFLTGRDRRHHCRPERPWLAFLPLALSLAALALLLAGQAGRSGRRGPPLLCRRRDRHPGGAGAARPSKDFVLARNLIPALVPLLAAIAIASPRPPRAGSAPSIGAPSRLLARLLHLGEHLDGPAAAELERRRRHIGEPEAPRATVTWVLGEAPLRYYLSTGAIQVRARKATTGWSRKSTSSPTAGAAAAAPAARAGLPRSRARRRRPPLHPPLPLAGPGPGAAAAAGAARGGLDFRSTASCWTASGRSDRRRRRPIGVPVLIAGTATGYHRPRSARRRYEQDEGDRAPATFMGCP